jgi:hypothetical protein
VTLFLLPTDSIKRFEIARDIVESSKEEVHKILGGRILYLQTSKLSFYVGRGVNKSSIFCTDFIKTEEYFKFQEICDLFTNKFLEANVISRRLFSRLNIAADESPGKFYNNNLHITFLNTNHHKPGIPVLQLDPSPVMERFREFNFGRLPIDTLSLFESCDTYQPYYSTYDLK